MQLQQVSFTFRAGNVSPETLKDMVFVLESYVKAFEKRGVNFEFKATKEDPNDCHTLQI